MAAPTLAQSSTTTGLAGLRDVDNPPLLTLNEAFRLAGERSLDLRIAQLKVDESKATVTKAWSAVVPSLSLGAEYTFNFPEQEAALGSEEQFQQQALLFESIANITEGAAAQNPDPIARQAAFEQAAELRDTAKTLRNTEVTSFVVVPAHVVNGSLQFAMPLFSPRSVSAVQNAYSGVEITRLSVRSAQANVLWGVARTYAAAAGTRALLGTVAEQVESTKRHFTRVENRHALGYETDLALERARLDVKKAEMQERQAKAGYKSAKAALAALIGAVSDFDVDAAPAIGAGLDAVGFNELLTRAYDSRVDFKVQKHMLELADRGRRDAWMRFLPSFQLVAQGRYTSNTSGLTNQPITGAVIVQGSLPLYDGGQTFGAIDEANAKVSQELLRVRQIEEGIERELRGTLDDLAVKKDAVTTTAELATLAKQQAQNAENLYDQGMVTQNDLADARLGAFAAAVDAQRAQFDLQTAQLGLAHAIGELQAYIKLDDSVPAPLADDEAERARQAMDRVKE